jgi:hypothetical protein
MGVPNALSENIVLHAYHARQIAPFISLTVPEGSTTLSWLHTRPLSLGFRVCRVHTAIAVPLMYLLLH